MSEANRRYTQITKAVYERPWAIQPAMLAVIEEIVRLRAVGAPLTDEEIDARVSAASNGPRRGPQRAQGVAVIPIYGVISQRMNLMSAMSGGTSVEGITRSFREALADPDVGSIVFDIDSPGGTVDGIDELASEIRAARGRKPMTAVSNTVMASAAYYIGSAADEIIATPSAQVGSIGIIGMHHDVSKAEEMEGVKVTLITAGDGKDQGNEHIPLSDEGRAEMQGIADDFYAMFVDAVAASRGVEAAVVTDEWKASVFTAKKALAAGLVDRVDTLDNTVRQMAIEANGGRMSAAAASFTGAFSERLAALTAEASGVAAHAQERARLRAKQGRPGVSDPNREQLSALATSLGSIQSDITAVLATADPEPDPPTPPPAETRRHPALDLFEAMGRYGLPASEVPTP